MGKRETPGGYWERAPMIHEATNTHARAYLDLRTELCDLRKRYLRSGWVDSGMEEGFDNLIDRLEQLENGERSPVEVVRRIVGECVAWVPSHHTRAEEMQFEDERVDRLMRLIRHREGHHNVHS